MTQNSRTITISIAKPPRHVYAFASNPENLPRWLTFITGVKRSGDDWFMQTDTGDIKIQFLPPNEHGILDHTVTLPNGQQLHNPMRVVPNADGSELLFTLFQHPGMSDEEFATDAATVQRDLQMLKTVLER